MTGQRFVFRFQRVGGWCEPIGRTSLTPPRASDRTAKFSLSRFGRISAVKERAFGHEWARLRQTEWYRGEKNLRLFFAMGHCEKVTFVLLGGKSF